MSRAVRAVLILATLVCGTTAAFGYAFLGSRWPDGSIVMHLQLGSSGTLLDGSSSWGASFEGALANWNTYLSTVSFRVVRDSTAAKLDGNGINNVFWDNDVYGDSFGSSTLAVTTRRTRGTTRTEADVIFNTRWSWNSYRGALRNSSSGGRLYDFRRVALHETGHALGLDHPDEEGQRVSAVMNSTTSDLDSLTSDDITGVQVLYSTPTVTVTAPGRPTGMTASASGSTVTLRWTAPTSGGSPTSYTIEAGSSPGASNLANFATGSTATSFSSSGVGPGVYYVRVRASNSAGTSAASDDAVLTVGGGCTGAPSAPSGLRVVSNVGGTVVLSWTASATGTPTTYLVEAGSSSGAANLANSDLGGTSTSLTAMNVGRGTYFVRVRGRNACGIGSASNEIVLVVS